MSSFILTILVVSWVLLILSIALMSPKWGLWVIGWASIWGDWYWSQKSLETTLKKTAIINSIIFCLCCIAYPFVG